MFSPRVYLSPDSLAATGLLGKQSFAMHRVHVKLPRTANPEAIAAAMKEKFRSQRLQIATVEERKRDLVLASVAVIYTLFMILAGGLKFILLSAILYAPGTALYYVARRERKLKVFDSVSDWVIFVVAAVAAVVGVVAMATGRMAI